MLKSVLKGLSRNLKGMSDDSLRKINRNRLAKESRLKPDMMSGAALIVGSVRQKATHTQ